MYRNIHSTVSKSWESKWLKFCTKANMRVNLQTKMSTSNVCQQWNVPYLLKRGTAWNVLRLAETTWCHMKPPSNQPNHPKLPKNSQKMPDITWYQPQHIFFTKKELLFSSATFMLCLKVIFGQSQTESWLFFKLR